MELKEFNSRQDVLDAYNFPFEQQSEDPEHCWFFVPIETQLSNFVNGLGRIYYSTFMLNKKVALISEEAQTEDEPKYLNTIITDFVLIKELVHDHTCKCAKCDHSPAEMIKLEGFEDCYIGCGVSYAEYPAVAYDYEKIIQKLMVEKNLSQDEVEVYFHDKIFLDYKREKMPIFINKVPYESI